MFQISFSSPQFLRTFALSAAVTLGAGAAVFSPVGEAAAGGTVDCAKLKKSKAKAVCERLKGGETEMKKAMKAAQNALKKASGGTFKDGSKVKCTSCHEKGSGGALKAESDKYWAEFEPHLK